MDESHLDASADPPESTCSMVCDKIMKNMVLTLTILGKCSWHWRCAVTFTSYISAYFGLSCGGEAGVIAHGAVTGGWTNAITPTDD